MWMEAVYHLPLSVWVLGGLVKGESIYLWFGFVLLGGRGS